jgi:ABC-type multidrug transport system fused ATPase/permease subunit
VARRRQASLSANVTEKLSQLATVQAFGQMRREHRLLRRQSDRLLEASVTKATRIGSLRAVIDAAAGACALLVLALAYLVPGQQLSPGMVAAVISIVGFLTPPLRDLGRVQEYWLAAQVACENLGQLAEQPIPETLRSRILSRPARRRHHLYLPLALAASFALVAVLLVRQESSELQLQDRLAVMQQQILQLRQQTLENVPSGRSASWVGSEGNARIEVMPVKSYRTPDNRFCREYEERIEDAWGAEVRRGIACRTGKGIWPEQASVSVPSDSGSGQTGVGL